jgi:hypothetical protein
VTCLNVNAFDNVSVFSGNKTTVPAVAPINVKNNSLFNRILGHSWRQPTRLWLQLIGHSAGEDLSGRFAKDTCHFVVSSRRFVFLAATDPGGNGAVTS